MKPSYFRPRWINSGSFLGPAKDMLEYFQAVEDRMNEHFHFVTAENDLSGDQGIFGEIFGEQEVWRKALAIQDQTGARSSTQPSFFPMPTAAEYHVGLDYAQELFYPTCHSETMGFFVHLQDSASVESESRCASVGPSRMKGIPSDLIAAPNSFAQLEHAPMQNLSWGEVALYPDFWTTSVPVAIHNNAWKNGLKGRQQTWWDKTWFFPYLRDLLKIQLDSNATKPIATFHEMDRTMTVMPQQVGEQGCASMLFVRERGSDMSHLVSTDWNTICRDRDDAVEAVTPWFDEVFRDGKGPP